MKLIITDPAKQRLKDISDFYREMGYAKKGRAIEVSILKAAKLIPSHPRIGRIEEHLKVLNEGHRSLIQGNYKIIYKIYDETIMITDIFDCRQDPRKMKG